MNTEFDLKGYLEAMMQYHNGLLNMYQEREAKKETRENPKKRMTYFREVDHSHSSFERGTLAILSGLYDQLGYDGLAYIDNLNKEPEKPEQLALA